MNETWKDINGFEGLYQVSNIGSVKSCSREWACGKDGRIKISHGDKILKGTPDKDGYLCVVLRKDGHGFSRKIHRIVADNFCVRGNGDIEVNHIDGNKTNNHSTNLEWTTRHLNMKHARRNGLIQDERPVLQKTSSGELVNRFPSIKSAARSFGKFHGNISRCLNGRGKTAYGFLWEFAL